MVMRRIGKSGNSLYVSLPQSFLGYLGVGQGSYLSVLLVKGKIILEPAEKEADKAKTQEVKQNG